MTAFEMYLLLKLDDFQSLAILPIMSALICLVIWVGFFAYAAGECEEYKQVAKGAIRKAQTGLLVSLVLYIGLVLLPSTKQMAAIIVVPKVVNAAASSPELRALPGKLVTLAGEWMDELRSDKKVEEVKK